MFDTELRDTNSMQLCNKYCFGEELPSNQIVLKMGRLKRKEKRQRMTETNQSDLQ